MDVFRLLGARALVPPIGGGAPPPADSALGARVGALEERFEKLVLVCHAQWALLIETTQVTEQELIDKIREIDLSDGLLDGRVRVPVVECTKCGRTLSQRHGRCLYCGTPRSDDHAFRV